MLGRMGWRLPSALAVVFALAVPASASAACGSVPGNLVADCSFEQPAVANGGFSSFNPGTTFSSWAVSTGGDAVDLVNRNFGGGYPVADGNQALDLNHDRAGGVEQPIATSSGTKYRITFSVAQLPAAAANCGAFEPQKIRVGAAGVAQTFSYTPNHNATPPGNQTFDQHSVDFTASSATTLVTFRSVTDGCAGPVLDDITVAQAPPDPAPVLGKSMTASVVSGTVLARLPGSSGSTPISVTTALPVGTIVDARKGRVRITATAGGKTFFGDFYEGVFQIAQRPKNGATADLKLFGGSFKGCPKAPRAAAAKGKKKSIRHLWGQSDGKFRTIGRFSAAAVRGTTWLTDDQCTGTLTKVTAGAVSVRDFVKRKNVVVRAGGSYLARSRG
jgi:hypothetical protein